MPGKCTSTLEKGEECEVPFKKKRKKLSTRCFLHDKSRLIYFAEDASGSRNIFPNKRALIPYISKPTSRFSRSRDSAALWAGFISLREIPPWPCLRTPLKDLEEVYQICEWAHQHRIKRLKHFNPKETQ